MVTFRRITYVFAAVLFGIGGSGYAQSDAARLHYIFEEEWIYQLETFPEFATSVGYPGQNHRWTDYSFEALEAHERHQRQLLEKLRTIERGSLSERDRLNYDLFRRDLELEIEGQQFPSELLPITQMRGIQQGAVNTLTRMPIRTAKDYKDILARIRGIEDWVDQTIALLRRGLEEGVTPPKITLRDVPNQFTSLSRGVLENNPLWTPFEDLPETISPPDRERILEEGRRAIRQHAAPAFKTLDMFFASEYLPDTTESIAATDRPDGEDWYAYLVRVMTTTNMTPKEIHELGLSEVKRIRAEMDRVIEESGFEGSFEEFTEFLRTDPQFYFTEKEDLLRAYRDIAKRVDPELVKLFGTLPRTPYGVKAIPEYTEKSQTTAYYMRGSLDAGLPGYFYANTYWLETRPKWEMEALTIHEAVPGHHLQISIAQELEGLPEFRKWTGPTAFVEGWGLYAESLGEEMGFYQDPYSKFGQLTYEIWRAIRLVVDTGMHAFGWSRQEAIDYFMANSGKQEHDITVEIDRYIAWPGQALAYKIGELTFKRLRAKAEAELGENFDIRAFHDALLENGALPMDVLEAQFEIWLETQKRMD